MATMIEVLKTWEGLNDYLRACKDAKLAKELLDTEKKNKKRPTILKRIYSRYATLRRAQEMKELLSK